ncbi:ABC transporter permease [Terrarubrum flagellatum]|uniref:ABC transporter permease n=1 Tax=Terrirubrum flagellatum TaxID=2895980 RepID=UPI003145095D
MGRTHPALVAVTVAIYAFLLAPLVIVIGAAFSETTYLAFPPQGLSLKWFANALANSDFRRSFVTSMEVALLGTGLALVAGAPAAYALARFRPRLPRGMGNMFVLPILVPEIVTGFALLKLLAVDWSLPILAALTLGHALLVLPYCVRVISANFAAFDFSIEEAAISLGSPPLKTFFTVVLPNVRSAVLAAFVLSFITSLNDVSISVFLTGPGVNTLPIQVLSYVEQYFDPTVAAVSVLLMVLTVGVMAVVERTLGLTTFTK